MGEMDYIEAAEDAARRGLYSRTPGLCREACAGCGAPGCTASAQVVARAAELCSALVDAHMMLIRAVALMRDLTHGVRHRTAPPEVVAFAVEMQALCARNVAAVEAYRAASAQG